MQRHPSIKIAATAAISSTATATVSTTSECSSTASTASAHSTAGWGWPAFVEKLDVSVLHVLSIFGHGFAGVSVTETKAKMIQQKYKNDSAKKPSFLYYTQTLGRDSPTWKLCYLSFYWYAKLLEEKTVVVELGESKPSTTYFFIKRSTNLEEKIKISRVWWKLT